MSIRFKCDVCNKSMDACSCIANQYDPVNSPSHYSSGGVECIDAIQASMSHEAFCGYLKGNIQKYMWRYEKKANPVQDLEKAQWYQNKLIEVQKAANQQQANGA